MVEAAICRERSRSHLVAASREGAQRTPGTAPPVSDLCDVPLSLAGSGSRVPWVPTPVSFALHLAAALVPP